MNQSTVAELSDVTDDVRKALIEQYYKYPPLWDRTVKADKSTVNNAWDFIAAAVSTRSKSFPAKIVKIVVKNLRDQFNRVHRKALSSGSESVSWKFYSDMMFLADQFSSGSTKSPLRSSLENKPSTASMSPMKNSAPNTPPHHQSVNDMMQQLVDQFGDGPQQQQPVVQLPATQPTVQVKQEKTPDRKRPAEKDLVSAKKKKVKQESPANASPPPQTPTSATLPQIPDPKFSPVPQTSTHEGPLYLPNIILNKTVQPPEAKQPKPTSPTVSQQNLVIVSPTSSVFNESAKSECSARSQTPSSERDSFATPPEKSTVHNNNTLFRPRIESESSKHNGAPCCAMKEEVQSLVKIAGEMNEQCRKYQALLEGQLGLCRSVNELIKNLDENGLKQEKLAFKRALFALVDEYDRKLP